VARHVTTYQDLLRANGRGKRARSTIELGASHWSLSEVGCDGGPFQKVDGIGPKSTGRLAYMY
jgi:hypothetical protein